MADPGSTRQQRKRTLSMKQQELERQEKREKIGKEGEFWSFIYVVAQANESCIGDMCHDFLSMWQ